MAYTRLATHDIDLGWGAWRSGASDGTTLWFVDQLTNTAVAYVAATRARDRDKDISLEDLSWNSATTDGTTLWFEADDVAYAYTAATLARNSAFDLDLNDIFLSGTNGDWRSAACDGVTAWFVNISDNTAYALTTATRTSDSSRDIDLSLDATAATSDGTLLFFIDDSATTARAYQTSDQTRVTAEDINLSSGDWEGALNDGETIWFINNANTGSLADTGVAYQREPSDAELTLDSSFGTLSSSLSLLANLDLQLSDFDATGLESDTLALLKSTSDSGSVYADSDRGGTGAPLDGELGLGTEETLISRIRITNLASPNRTRILLNDDNRPDALELVDYFGTNGDGNDLTFSIQTAQGIVSQPAANYVSAGGGFINFDFTSVTDRDILQGITTDTRFIVAFTRAVSTEASISTSGDIGTLSGTLRVQASSAGDANASVSSDIGTISGTLRVRAMPPGDARVSTLGDIGDISGSLRIQASDAGKAEISSESSIGTLSGSLSIQASSAGDARIRTQGILGTLNSTLSLRAILGLQLLDFDTTGLESDVLALLVSTSDGGAVYADSDRGGTGSPLDGELGISTTETVISRISILNSGTLLRLNHNDNPLSLSLLSYFQSGGDGDNLTLTIQTLQGAVTKDASDFLSAGAGYINYNFQDSDDQAILQGIVTDTRFIIAYTRSVITEANVSTSGDIGTLSSVLRIQADAPGQADITTDSSLGVLASTLRVQAKLAGDAKVSSESTLGTLSGSLGIQASSAGQAQAKTQGTIGTLQSTLSLRAVAPTFVRVETDSTLGTLTATLSLKADDNVKIQATEVTEIYLNGRSEYDPKYLANLASLGTKLDINFRTFRWRNSPKSRTQTLRFHAYSPTTPGQYHILSGNTIYMYERGNSEPSFGGSVETAIEDEYVPNRFQYQVTCTDWITWLDHNRFVHTFDSKPASGMIDEMLERLKAEINPGSPDFYYGFTTDNVIEGGPDIEKQEIDRTRSPSSFLQFLANTLGWLWWIDAERDIHFVPNFIGEAPDPFIDWEDQPIGDDDIDGGSPPYWKLQITETRKDVRDRLSIRDFNRESDDKTVQIELGDGKKTFFPQYAPPSSLESFTASYRQVAADGTAGPWVPYTVLEDGVHGLGGDGNEGFFLCLWNQGVRIEPAPKADDSDGDIEVKTEYNASQPSFFQTDEPDAQEVMMSREGEGTGIYEEVISMPDLQVKDERALEERADTFFRRQAYPHRYGRFNTYRNGWQPGQTFILCSRYRQGGTPSNPYEQRYFVQTVNKRILTPYDESGVELVETDVEYADDFWGGP